MKKAILILAIFLLSIAVVLARESHDSEIEEGKNLVESKISCDKLSNEQLEAIGEYYMEQMHPGAAHEIMDNMMGGEGSASLKQVHINMAKRLYCNDNIYIGYGMMGSGGMMGFNGGYGSWNMMGGLWPSSWFGVGFGMLFVILFWVAVIWLIVWVVKTYAMPQKKSSALDILKRRYAKGEITKKEFEGLKKEFGE